MSQIIFPFVLLSASFTGLTLLRRKRYFSGCRRGALFSMLVLSAVMLIMRLSAKVNWGGTLPEQWVMPDTLLNVVMALAIAVFILRSTWRYR